MPLDRWIAIGSLAMLFGSFGSSAFAAERPSADANAATTLATASVASVESEIELCAEETNRYRASIGLGPLARSAELERFTARAASLDSGAREAHRHFSLTNGDGVSRAEIEVLWWRGFSVRSVVTRGLATMWEAGPGGSHYEVMAGPFSEIGCGISIKGGEVTVAQDFR